MSVPLYALRLRCMPMKNLIGFGVRSFAVCGSMMMGKGMCVSFSFWSKCGDSNSRPPVPETGALPTALHLVLMIFMRFSVSGQTCGQTENLRAFKTSGEPKKSVFSRGFSVFQNFRFEIGGLHPKLARYQLRYTSKELTNGKIRAQLL